MKECNQDDMEALILIREFEELLLAKHSEGKLHGTTHTCLGQEYIPVAIRKFFLKGDQIFSNHRGHGHYLARFNDPAGLLAEIMGKRGAVCNGVGGSQHIRVAGFFSTGIQGHGIGLAAGMAFSKKRNGNNDVVYCFIGDGTWGQGIVYESLNIASLERLPLIVIVENNGIAQTTATVNALSGTIEDRARAFGIDYLKIVDKDIALIREKTGTPILDARREPHPLLIEFVTDRLGPHSKGDDTRSSCQLSDIRKRDWYEQMRSDIGENFQIAESRVRRRLRQVVEEVESSPLSDSVLYL